MVLHRFNIFRGSHAFIRLRESLSSGATHEIRKNSCLRPRFYSASIHREKPDQNELPTTTQITQIPTTPPLRPYLTDSTTHFGFTTISVDEKQDKVKSVFRKVADSYDLMNDAMSGGLHRLWKDSLVDQTKVTSIAQRVQQDSSLSFHMLDVAGGTGDVAFRLYEAATASVPQLTKKKTENSTSHRMSVTVCDLNPDMLRVGQERARQRYGVLRGSDHNCGLLFQEGNAETLDFTSSDSSNAPYDLYTIAFGLRNVTNVDRALETACRVLKPGGRFLCLEFCLPQFADRGTTATYAPLTALWANVYDAYSFNVIPALGHALVGDRESYQYLVESIRQFPPPEELRQRMESVGMIECSYRTMTGGIVAVHEGYKPW